MTLIIVTALAYVASWVLPALGLAALATWVSKRAERQHLTAVLEAILNEEEYLR